MKKLPYKTRSNKKGVVIFVVLGAIFVLGVLVTSYNFFVRGKFNESREILKHLRAAKTAQATSNYIFTNILSDLAVTGQGSRKSAADILMSANEPGKLADELNSQWLPKIKLEDFVNSLLEGEIGNETPSVGVKFGFFDIKTLNSLKASNNVDDSIFFYDNEKVGRLTVQVTVNIGRSREIWQETRPFKVVCPFPVPLTKFSLYWKDGVGGSESYAFNASVVGSDGKFKGGKKPFLLDNGSLLGANNTDEQIWVDRGWIYVGGSGDLLLNRACGDKSFGQRFYSYPRPGIPATLMLEFPGGDGWENKLYRGERLGFRSAYWGFSDSMTANDSNNVWKKVLKNEFRVNGSKANYWNSSSLHMFSDVNIANGSSGEVTPSITRVVGNVYDRYIEMGYLSSVNSSNILFAAIINHSKSSFDRAKDELDNEDPELAEIAGTFDYVPYLYFSSGDPSQSSEEGADRWADVLDSYFSDFTYTVDNDPNAVSYFNVMSKVDKRSIDDTYDIISQYSQNHNEVNLPPHSVVPRYSEMKFKPSALNASSFENLDSVLKTMEIDKICDVSDSSLGTKLRVCYEIKGSSEDIVNALNSEFRSLSATGLDLNNLVYKVTPTDESMNLSGLRAMISPGTVYSDTAIKVTSLSSASSDENPLMIMSGKGAITVDGGREVTAYLVALGEGGSVKPANPSQKLCIRGGMAVKEFYPENIPNQGGYLAYNTKLDPTKNSFNSFMGVAFGPKGGGL